MKSWENAWFFLTAWIVSFGPYVESLPGFVEDISSGKLKRDNGVIAAIAVVWIPVFIAVGYYPMSWLLGLFAAWVAIVACVGIFLTMTMYSYFVFTGDKFGKSYLLYSLQLFFLNFIAVGGFIAALRSM